MGYSFDIKSSSDLHNELSQLVDDYKNNPLSSGKAVLCAILCWHVVEWLYNERFCFEHPSKEAFIRHVKAQCPSLSYIQDIANGTKHGNIRRYTPMVKTTAYHPGSFSSGFSKGFDTPSLQMTLEGNQVVYFDDEIINAMNFLGGYFYKNNDYLI